MPKIILSSLLIWPLLAIKDFLKDHKIVNIGLMRKHRMAIVGMHIPIHIINMYDKKLDP